ncbi:MAG: hypothetical protein KDD40_10830 [Bdellovibrionales bacterium]|nr:hypothetical protein [Bdellovibrionales bacterium]
MSKLYKSLIIVLGLICLGLILTVSVQSWRYNLRGLFISEAPKVLSTLQKDSFNDGRTIVFAKVKTSKGLFIQVYEKVSDGLSNSLADIRLPDSTDGYFHYRGQATNLALEDVDGDGRPEILAPSFDANQVAHLNVYTYNSATQQFEPLSPDAVGN